MSNDAFAINVPAMLTNNAEPTAQRYYIATIRAARSSMTVTQEIPSTALQDLTNIQVPYPATTSIATCSVG